MRHSINRATIAVTHIRLPSQLALPYPCARRGCAGLYVQELENAAYPLLFSNLLDGPFARTALDQEGTSSVLSYLGSIEASSLPYTPVFVLEQPSLPSFVVSWATFVHSVAYWALCASDLRRLEERRARGLSDGGIWSAAMKHELFRFLFWTNRRQGFCIEK